MPSKNKKAGLFERLDLKKIITKLQDKINYKCEEDFVFLSRSSSDILENEEGEVVELANKRYHSETDLNFVLSEQMDFTLKQYVFDCLRKLRNTTQDNVTDEKETKFLFRSPFLSTKSTKNIQRACDIDEAFVIEEEMKEKIKRKINLIRRMCSGFITLPKESEDILSQKTGPHVITGRIRSKSKVESDLNIVEKENQEGSGSTMDCKNPIKPGESCSSSSSLQQSNFGLNLEEKISDDSSYSNERIRREIKCDSVEELKYPPQVSSSSEIESIDRKVNQKELPHQNSCSSSDTISTNAPSSDSNIKKPSLENISKSSTRKWIEDDKNRSSSKFGNICRFLHSKKNNCSKEKTTKRRKNETQKKILKKKSKYGCMYPEDQQNRKKKKSKEMLCRKGEVRSSARLDNQEKEVKFLREKISKDSMVKYGCICEKTVTKEESEIRLKISSSNFCRSLSKENLKNTTIKQRQYTNNNEILCKSNKSNAAHGKVATFAKLPQVESPTDSFQELLYQDLNSNIELSNQNKQNSNNTKKTAQIIAPFDSSSYLLSPSYATVVSFRILTAICFLSCIRFTFTVGLLRYGMLAFTVAAAFSITGLLVSTKNFEKQNSSDSLDHYNMTHAFVNGLLVPFVAAEMWSLNNYDKYVNIFYVLLSLAAVPGYFMTNKEPVQKLANATVIFGLLILMVVSVLHQNTAGLAAAIVYGVTFLSDDDLLSQIDIDLFLFTNFGRGVFIYLSSMALRGAKRGGAVCLCHALHRS